MTIFVPKSALFKISEAKKKAGKFCCAHGCQNQPHAKKRGFCHKHYHRWRKIIDPVYDRYANFKTKAKQRHKEFTITLAEFRQFCIDNEYIIKKGRRGRICTIDRIDNRYGYHIWNIQILTIWRNVDKYHSIDKLLTEENNEPIPF